MTSEEMACLRYIAALATSTCASYIHTLRFLRSEAVALDLLKLPRSTHVPAQHTVSPTTRGSSRPSSITHPSALPASPTAQLPVAAAAQSGTSSAASTGQPAPPAHQPAHAPVASPSNPQVPPQQETQSVAGQLQQLAVQPQAAPAAPTTPVVPVWERTGKADTPK